MFVSSSKKYARIISSYSWLRNMSCGPTKYLKNTYIWHSKKIKSLANVDEKNQFQFFLKFYYIESQLSFCIESANTEIHWQEYAWWRYLSWLWNLVPQWVNRILSFKLFLIYFAILFILDQFPYHVWVGEHQRSVVGDTAEKIHTIAKMVLHKNFQYPQPPNDIGNVHIFSEYKTFFANQWDSEKKNVSRIFPFYSIMEQRMLIHTNIKVVLNIFVLFIFLNSNKNLV